jgi:hypothetical protein
MRPDPLHFSAAQNGQPLIPDGFTVDYDNGIITLANPLAAGQTLTVQFWASDRSSNETSVFLASLFCQEIAKSGSWQRLAHSWGLASLHGSPRVWLAIL